MPGNSMGPASTLPGGADAQCLTVSNAALRVHDLHDEVSAIQSSTELPRAKDSIQQYLKAVRAALNLAGPSFQKVGNALRSLDACAAMIDKLDVPGLSSNGASTTTITTTA